MVISGMAYVMGKICFTFCLVMIQNELKFLTPIYAKRSTLNTYQCKFDGGDCLEFNVAYPLCDVEKPSLVGNGVCDGGEYNTERCAWDGKETMFPCFTFFLLLSRNDSFTPNIFFIACLMLVSLFRWRL